MGFYKDIFFSSFSKRAVEDAFETIRVMSAVSLSRFTANTI